MTTIPANKRELGVVAVVMVVFFGAAAVRATQGPQGGHGAPVVGAVFGMIALGILVVWLKWRRRPPWILTITSEEISYGPPGRRPVDRITRDASGRLFFRMGWKGSGWRLRLADSPDRPAILLTGFNLREVERACVAHGWTFS